MAKALLTLVFFLASSLLIAAPAPAATPKKQLNWSELSTEQQQTLSPLSAEWDVMDAIQKRKWLGIAKRYPKMKPAAQMNATKRMQDWAALTPSERQAARERFRKLEKLPLDKKQTLSQKWEQYQQLPEAEREQLRELANRKKNQSRVVKDPAHSSSSPATTSSSKAPHVNGANQTK